MKMDKGGKCDDFQKGLRGEKKPRYSDRQGRGFGK